MHYTFSGPKGLHTDLEPLQQPEGTYRVLVNGIRTLSGAIQNEPGHQELFNFQGKPLIGHCLVGQDAVLFMGLGEGSEIGVLSADDRYRVVLSSPELNFSERVSAQSKTNYLGQQLVYFVDGVNPNRVLNLQDVPIQDVGDNLRLQAFNLLPVPEVTAVLDGGNVPTGIYQFIGRLLTSSGNATGYGLLTEPVPVVNEPESTGDWRQFDGAPPQTPASKSLRVEFTNLDRDFAVLEVVVVTYLGTGNQRVAYRVGQVPINGRSNLSFTYVGEEQHQQPVEPESFIVPGVVYDTARVATAHQGRLVLTSVTSSKPDEGVNWQDLAQLVQVKYSVTELDAVGLNSYRSELNAGKLRGYRRDEVYSLAFAPVFRAYQDRTAYHLCPPVGVSGPGFPKAFLSQEEYPPGLGYPQGNVRHFQLPSLREEPLLTADGQKLRVLGWDVDFSALYAALPDAVRKEVVGFSVLRQPLPESQKRVLAQGIAAIHTQDPTQDGLYTLSAYHGRGVWSNFVQDPDRQKIGFFSPESIIYQSDSLARATQLQVVGVLQGTQFTEGDKRTGDGLRDLYYHLRQDYPVLSYGGSTGQTVDLLPEYGQYIQPGPDGELDYVKARQSIQGRHFVSQVDSNGYLYLESQQALPQDGAATEGNGLPESYYQTRTNATDLFFMNGVEMGKSGQLQQGRSERLLYNLLRSQPRPYGAPTEATYYRIGYAPASSLRAQAFGGDTFIGKFGVVSTVRVEMKARTLSYFFCESAINVEHRHYLTPDQDDGQSGTVPYYPKLNRVFTGEGSNPGVLDFSPALGHPRGYNRQYSFVEATVPYVPKGLLERTVTDFRNRSVFTPVQLEGEQQDQWRYFLPADYHDVPRSHGLLTDAFVLGSTFFHHSEGCLWRSFTGEAQTIQTSTAEAFLSSGAFFGRPSEPVLTVDGGYAGTQGRWGLTTPEGRYFVDAVQHKLWRFNGQLEDLSAQGRLLWSEANLGLDEDTVLQGYRLVRDYHQGFPRVLLTRLSQWTHSYSPAFNSWTGEHTYLPAHVFSRGAELYLSAGSRLYKRLRQSEYGRYLGGEVQATELLFAANVEPKLKKRWDNLVLTEEVRQVSGEQVHQQSITGLQLYNDRCNTGALTVVVPTRWEAKQTYPVFGQVFGERRGEHTNLAVPADLVLDPNGRILDPQNLAPDAAYRRRVTGLFALVRLSYDNQTGHRYTLQAADVLCRSYR